LTGVNKVAAAEGDACDGKYSVVMSCSVGSNGDCNSQTVKTYSCVIHNGSCQANIPNQICGYNSNHVCAVIYGSPAQKWVTCNTGSGGGSGGTTSTPGCTSTCTKSVECKLPTNCSGAGNQGGQCGVTSGGVKKYFCNVTKCTTVCISPTTAPTVNCHFEGCSDCASHPGYYFSYNPTCSMACSLGCQGKWPKWSGEDAPGYVNTNGDEYVRTPACQVNCGLITPTTAPTARCNYMSAYSTNWVAYSPTQLSAMKAGDTLYYCASGSASSGNFDMARFTINGVLMANTTLIRPGSADYCQKYVIPSGTYNFDIIAQLHHVTLGWVY
jgi:hypothetical protein